MQRAFNLFREHGKDLERAERFFRERVDGDQNVKTGYKAGRRTCKYFYSWAVHGENQAPTGLRHCLIYSESKTHTKIHDINADDKQNMEGVYDKDT
jgi:hypothetical protein